jgi:hypothetical protein
MHSSGPVPPPPPPPPESLPNDDDDDDLFSLPNYHPAQRRLQQEQQQRQQQRSDKISLESLAQQDARGFQGRSQSRSTGDRWGYRDEEDDLGEEGEEEGSQDVFDADSEPVIFDYDKSSSLGGTLLLQKTVDLVSAHKLAIAEMVEVGYPIERER